jgi:very-short-patch-repair endonuclease
MVLSMELFALLRSFGDSARVKDLLAAGVSERQLRSALDAKVLYRPRRGIVALPAARQDLLAARIAGGVLTCTSAALHHGLWQLRPDTRVHLASVRDCREQEVSHGAISVPPMQRLPVAGLVDVVVHALRCLPEDDALVIAESALKSGNVALETLKIRLQGPRNGTARRRLELADGRADSAPEVVVRGMLRRAGLEFRHRVWVKGIGEVDFLVDGWLIIEFDGAAFHMDRKSFRRDLRRNNAGVVRSYATLRFVYEDVFGNEAGMLRDILQASQRRPRGVA